MRTPQTDAWVTRVLGLTLPTTSSVSAPRPLRLRPARPPAARPIRHVSVEGRALWNSAREEVEGQLAGLQSRLLGSGDPDLMRVGELGLSAVTRRLNTALVVSLIEVDSAPPEAATTARAKALGAVADMRTLLQSDPLIQLLDKNTLGVPVAIRATLGGALQKIEAVLA